MTLCPGCRGEPDISPAFSKLPIQNIILKNTPSATWSIGFASIQQGSFVLTRGEILKIITSRAQDLPTRSCFSASMEC